MQIILSSLGLLIAAGVFFLYTQPTYDNVKAIQLQIDQYNQVLDKATELKQLRQSLLTRFNEFKPDDLDRLQKLLPDHVDNIRLIMDLDNLAGDFGMTLQNVSISNAPSASASTDQTAISAVGASEQKYDSLTMGFTTSSTYADFVRFLEKLESSLRIVDLTSLSISRNGSSAAAAAPQSKTKTSLSSATANEPTYTFKITIKTYWLR